MSRSLKKTIILLIFTGKSHAMKSRASLVIVIGIWVIFMNSCKEEEKEEILGHTYEGKMAVVYTKGFPSFSTVVRMDISIDKFGTVTFSGGGASDSFDAEDVYYEDGKPATKIKMSGSLTFNAADGEVRIDGGEQNVLIRVDSKIDGQMTVWGWDDDLGWIQVLDIPYTYEDKFSDGPLQFNLLQATNFYGQDISMTLPDLQGTFTYGYNLTLSPF
jgi:hypothetical protein